MTYFWKTALDALGRRAVALLLLCAPLTVEAATVKANYIERLYGLNVRRTINGNQIDTSAGMFHFQQTGGNHSLPDTHFYAFCIEPFESVASGVHNIGALESGATNIGGMGGNRANQLRELFSRYAPVLHVDLIDALDARALQVASWEIVRETALTRNVLTGNTRFSQVSGDSMNNAMRTLVYNRANVMLASLTGDPNVRLRNYYALTCVGTQDVIVQSTPEPSSLILMGCGLGALVYCSGRRKRSLLRRADPAKSV